MTSVLDRDQTELEAIAAESQQLLPPEQEEEVAGQAVVRTTPLAIAAALSGMAPAWLVTRLFRGGLAPFVATVLGVLIGAGVTWFSYRTRRASFVQILVLPVSLVVGAILMAPAATGGSANLIGLVGEALRAGGLRQAPVSFDPGWRLLCVVILAVTTAAAMAVAATLNRPQLVAVFPLPLTAGAALIQPHGAEVTSSAVAIVFVIGGLMVGYGAALGAESGGDGLGGRFEARRLARGSGLLAGIVVLLVILAQTDFLFPATNRDQVLPPQKPPAPRPTPDRPLFTVKSTRPGPWRVGVLDGYGDNGFLLPPVDPKRTEVVPKSGVVTPGHHQSYTATFTIKDLPGHLIPTPAAPAAVSGSRYQLEFDPRTEVLKVRNTRVPAGLSYTVQAVVPPTADQMAKARPPTPAILKEFGAAPPAPAAVRDLLAQLPPDTTSFDRLQAVRQALYDKVIAAGAGKPVDVPPARVSAMLGGAEATPYEITAAEVLLARWAGVPARVGFGFSGGDAVGGVQSFRPRDGSAWLEAYFEGYGWVPIVGTPPRAKASLSPQEKKNDPKVVATDELALTVYVPVRRQDVRLLFEIVRYWLVVFGPIVLFLLALAISYPAILKLFRRRRRVRWALSRSPAARVLAAYAEFRDRANDLNVGHPRHTPLEFLDAVADDDEHTELAWLVTRLLWGDLARDVRVEDVEAAEDMARSVRRRLSREQTGINRALGHIARASLRDPYTDEVPNLWPSRRPAVRPAGSGRRGLRRRRLATAAAAATMILGSCSSGAALSRPDLTYPKPLVPGHVGTFELRAEPSLAASYRKAKGDAMVSGGRVYTIRDGDNIQGSVQIALFKPSADVRRHGLQQDVEDGLNAGLAVTRRIGLIHVRALSLPEQQVFLWFPPDHNVMELFILRKKFEPAEQVVESIIAFQRHLPPAQETS